MKMIRFLVACCFGLVVLVGQAHAQQGAAVSGVAINRTTVNSTAIITTGNTFQTIVTAGPKQSLTIQNNNATDSCWLSFGTFSGATITAANATKGRSILLLAGGSLTRYWPFVPSDEIEATCATTSDTMYIDVQ